MTNNIDKPIEQLRLYSTAPHPCSYLDEEASTLFIDPDATIDYRTFSYLNERGFRRSGQHIYKPNCLNCQACLSYRVLADEFTLSKSQKRISKKNQDVDFSISHNILSHEHYSLYEKYIEQRHSDGDMYPASYGQYQSFLGKHHDNSFYLEARIDEKLIAIAVIDQCDQGLSAVYTFFDPCPSLNQRSLGQLMILQQLSMVKNSPEMRFLYLGYWVKGSPKMEYKSNYKPAEVFLNRRWIRLN